MKSYRYNSILYKNFPQLNKGVGMFYVPLVFLFFGLSILIFPIVFFKNRILFSNKKNIEFDVIQFVFTSNQMKCAIGVDIKNALIIDFTNNVFENKLAKVKITNNKIFLILIFNSWKIFISLCKIYFNKKVKSDGIRVIKSFAISEIAKFYFKQSKVMIQYNDHSPYNVLVFDLAIEYGLKTVYIQHAPVSFDFPPLYHDFNVIFGKDSYVKYQYTSRNNFNKFKVFELYDVRFPKLEDLPVRSPEYVLICFNNLDDLEKVKECAIFFFNKNYKVKIRPHPADKREINIKNIEISKNTTIWDDLKNALFVIVNESAIPLESLYYYIPTYKLNSFSKEIKDTYGFFKNGVLIKEYSNEDEILNDINKKKVTWDRDKIFYFLGNINDRNIKLKKLYKEIENLNTNNNN